MARRLAAIMVADMVGYSRLMEADEAGTLARQQAYLAELIEPAIAARSGEVVKRMGDGLLAAFASVVDAVQCAVDIQNAMAEREAGSSEDRRIRYRIGINLGDVIVENGDMFGDGVNIAARLEQLAEPGGICVSGTAYDHLKANVDVGYEPLGAVPVKNISQAVRAYRVVADPAHAMRSTTKAPRRHRWRLLAGGLVLALAAVIGVWRFVGQEAAAPGGIADARQAVQARYIAVLPFENMSGDPGQDYFVAGVTEDITTALSQLAGIDVKAGAAVRRLAGAERDQAAVAAELGVSHLLAGSIRRDAENVRITAKLIEAASGAQIWAERYDRKTQDVFAIQDEISGRVAAALAASLKIDAPAPRRRAYAPDIAAYDAYILGRAQRIPPTPQNLAAALESFQAAMRIDPKFAGGYAGAAYVHVLLYEFSSFSPAVAEENLQTALRLAEAALQLDPEFGPAWGEYAEVLSKLGRHGAALDAIDKAIERAPSDALMRGYRARYLGYAGRPEEGIEQVKVAMRMSPDSLPMLFVLGANYRAAGMFDAATEALVEHRARLGGKVLPGPTTQLIAAYVQAGHLESAREEAGRLMAVAPKLTLASAARLHSYQSEAQNVAFLGALRQAGVPE